MRSCRKCTAPAMPSDASIEQELAIEEELLAQEALATQGQQTVLLVGFGAALAGVCCCCAALSAAFCARRRRTSKSNQTFMRRQSDQGLLKGPGRSSGDESPRLNIQTQNSADVRPRSTKSQRKPASSEAVPPTRATLPKAFLSRLRRLLQLLTAFSSCILLTQA